MVDEIEPVDDDLAGEDSGKPTLLDAAKKWLGIGAAAVSALSALYGTLEYQADKTTRSQEIAALQTTSDTELKAHDYPAAWASLKSAVEEIDQQGVLVRALGGLSQEQARVHAAQEQLAMTWLREGAIEAGVAHTSDELLPVLATAASGATGAAKADLLAHIGFAYRLKALDGAKGLQELQFYKDAIALDPSNPYANTFWALPVVAQTSGSEAGVAQAKKLYDTALSSPRAQGDLRQWIRTQEQASLRGRVGGYPAVTGFFWQIVGDMHKAGEPLSPDTLSELRSQYLGNEISVPAFTTQLNAALTYLPAPVHVELLQELLKTQEEGERKGELQIVLGLALEKAGKPQEAVAMWHAARSSAAVSGMGGDILAKQIDAAIGHLSPGAPATAAAPAKPTPVSAKPGKHH